MSVFHLHTFFRFNQWWEQMSVTKPLCCTHFIISFILSVRECMFIVSLINFRLESIIRGTLITLVVQNLTSLIYPWSTTLVESVSGISNSANLTLFSTLYCTLFRENIWGNSMNWILDLVWPRVMNRYLHQPDLAAF